jgi:periplasmic protein TonB
MMNTLLESRPRKKRATGGTIFSVIFHATVVLLAVFATARAGVARNKEPVVQKVNFIKTAEPKPVEKKPETPPPPPPKAKPVLQHHVANLPPAPKAEIAPPKGFKVLQAPVAISTRIPDIDLSAKFNPDDFSGKGVKGGSATGVAGSNGTREGAVGGVDTNKNYDAAEVERQVSPISGTNIAYPESMRSSAVEGRVEAQFVVNENGRVETGTFKVLNSTNEAFTQAVRDALSRMRFRPAQIGKTNVSQVVQQAFVFNLNK